MYKEGDDVAIDFIVDGKPKTHIVKYEWLLVLCATKLRLGLDYYLKAKTVRYPGTSGTNAGDYLWIFDEPEEHPVYKGWYYVPNATGYLVNRSSNEVKSLNGQYPESTLKTFTATATEHLVTSLTADNGIEYKPGIHRLKCATFSGYDINVSNLHCNHIDSDPTNNEPSNLEFITAGQNGLHGRLCGNAKGHFNVKTTFEGKDLIHKSFRDHDVLTKEQLWLHYTGKQKIPGLVTVVESTTAKRIVNGDMVTPQARDTDGFKKVKVKLLDLETKETYEFISVSEAARFLDVEPSMVTFALYRSNSGVVKGRYSVASSEIEFKTLSLNQHSHIPKKRTILVKDITTGTITSFDSAKECRLHYQENHMDGFNKVGQPDEGNNDKNLSKKAFTTDLRNERQRLWCNRYLFKYEYVKAEWIK